MESSTDTTNAAERKYTDMEHAGQSAGPVHDKPVLDPLGTVVGEDGLARCPWSASPEIYIDYHDTEWGMPVRGEAAIFERLTLEAFQSGLSWLTILRKRPAFREAFATFDPDIIAKFSDADIERLMQDAGIIRNRQKIEATRKNAQAVIALRDTGGLDEFIWSRRPKTTPAPVVIADVPTQTVESRMLAKELKARGFAFVGPTTAYALMSAIGMVDTHLVGCHRRGSSGIFREDGGGSR